MDVVSNKVITLDINTFVVIKENKYTAVVAKVKDIVIIMNPNSDHMVDNMPFVAFAKKLPNEQVDYKNLCF